MKPRFFIPIVAALSMLGAISIDAYLPAVPAITREFQASPVAVQQTLSIYLLAFAFMTLFYGTLSDSFGRKPVLLVSTLVYIIASLGCALAPSLEWLLAFRALQGLSAGAGAVIGRAMIGDRLSGADAQRTMSYISVIFGLAPAVAPVLGGWLQEALGWRSIFGTIAVFAGLLLLALALWLGESLPVSRRHSFHPRTVVRHYLQVLGHGRFLCQSLAVAFLFSGIMVYVAGAAEFIIHILHLKATQFGWLFIPFIIGGSLGAFLAAKFSHRISPRRLIAAGFLCMAGSCVFNLVYTALYPAAFPWAVVPMVFYAFGMSVANPAMTVIALELFPEVRGLASSLLAFFQIFIFALASGLVVPLLFGSAFRMAAGGAAGFALSVLFWWLGTRGMPASREATAPESPGS